MTHDDIENSMNKVAAQAIDAVNRGKLAFCKFLAANDTGDTGTHQTGIYIAKPAISIIFDSAGVKGTNKDREVKIKWQDGFETSSRFVYYGQGTRNEYRITRFGRNFPYLRTEHTGDLFVLVKESNEDYLGYFLNTEAEINLFLDYFAMSPADTGGIIQTSALDIDARLDKAIQVYIQLLDVDFPNTKQMALAAQSIENIVHNHEEEILLKPDKKLLSWVEIEYSLFRKIEQERYGAKISKGFSSVEDFVVLANSVLNKRKSRAGKSLEHHLERIFDYNALRYSAQPKN